MLRTAFVARFTIEQITGKWSADTCWPLTLFMTLIIHIKTWFYNYSKKEAAALFLNWYFSQWDKGLSRQMLFIDYVGHYLDLVLK